MNRREKILAGLDLKSMTGAEIGALSRPVVRREDGAVLYVDHADTDTLRAKYRDDPLVDTFAIVDVSGVWGDKTLLEALGTKVDYIVASHVIEHVPDLVTWINELVSAMTDRGEIRLVVPDKRFTFDFRRRETVLSDVIPAYEARARAPMSAQVLEFALNMTPVSPADRWLGKGDSAPTRYTPDQARGYAEDSVNHTYKDVHCWVFTPASFARLMFEMNAAGLIELECAMFYDTMPGQLEFIVGLRRGSNARSWRKMEEQCRDWERDRLVRFHPRVVRGLIAGSFPNLASQVKRLIRR